MVRFAWVLLGVAVVVGAVVAGQSARAALAMAPSAPAHAETSAAADSLGSSPTLPLTVVPEPATWGLMGIGFAVAFAVRRRRG